MHAVLARKIQNDKQTLGEFYLYDKGKLLFSCKTLELPWKENRNRVSCIPTGLYRTSFRTVGKYAHEALHITTPDGEEVSGRSDILVHKGNYYTDILGCILLGKTFFDLNKDGLKDVTHSGKTVAELLAIAHEFTLEIIDAVFESVRVTATRLNFRDDSGKVLATLNQSTPLKVIGRDGHRTKVWINGWVHSDFIA